MKRPLTLIVRLWPRPEGFRAEVRPLEGGTTRLFTSPEALLDYLRTGAPERPGDGT